MIKFVILNNNEYYKQLNHIRVHVDHLNMADIIDDLNINKKKTINSSGKQIIFWTFEEFFLV